jgi:hypothetical protein
MYSATDTIRVSDDVGLGTMRISVDSELICGWNSVQNILKRSSSVDMRHLVK